MKISKSTYFKTLISVAVGSAGAALAYMISMPLYPLIGAALLISALSLRGLKFDVAPPVRDIAFVLIGINVGSAVTPDVIDTVIRWPVAFAALFICLCAIILVCQAMLVRIFKFDRQTGLMAAMPGHLTFSVGYGAAINADIVKITIVQTIRVLALTISVPLIARSAGIEMGSSFLAISEHMSLIHFVIVAGLSGLVGCIFVKVKIPAPFFLSSMLVSSAGHLSGFIVGGLHQTFFIIPLIVLGTMTGSRFGNVSIKTLRQVFAAGIAITIVSSALAALAAVSVAGFLSMPLSHVFVAFAPGGLETMIIMGAALGANPAFVTASHTIRLFALVFIIPFFVKREQR